MDLPNVNPKFLEEVKYFSTGNLSETVRVSKNSLGDSNVNTAANFNQNFFQ